MLPDAFLTRMQTLLGDEYIDFLASYDQAPSVGLRVNTLKLTPDQFSRIAPYPLTPIPWSPSGFIIPPDERPGKHPYHAAGLYYIQDPAAQSVAELLLPQPGERILDLSAAPGGKTTHIASLMKNRGVLVANDIHSKRVHDLAKNIERWGAQNVVILNETPPRLVEHFGSFFDRVLVDAPCSGEGMFRKDPAARVEWTPKLVESCAIRQDAILMDAARLVRPGGRLVYSTCTFAPEEDEQTIARFLVGHPDFEILEPPQFTGFSSGRPDWIGEDVYPEFSNTVRLWPHKALGEGHFVAVLQCKERGFLEEPRSWTPTPIPRDAQTYFDDFAESTLNWRPPQTRLALLGSHLYLLPEGATDLRGLHVIHWGWWLGTIKTKRFEPSHALGMGIKAEDARQRVDFFANDPETMAYLHGEVIPSSGKNGWVLVTVDGFPLGWGKRVQGRLKSHSPKWLRWI
jgi:NOL1/NOP2/sun family putative RNA methylase